MIRSDGSRRRRDPCGAGPLGTPGWPPRGSLGSRLPASLLDQPRAHGPGHSHLAGAAVRPRWADPQRPRRGLDPARALHGPLRLRRDAVPQGLRPRAARPQARHDDARRGRDQRRLRLQRGDRPRPRGHAVLLGARHPHRHHAARPLDRDALGRRGVQGARVARRADAVGGASPEPRRQHDGCAARGAAARRRRPGQAGREGAGRRRRARRRILGRRVDAHRRVGPGVEVARATR